MSAERLVLAKLAPEATLRKTIDAVQSRAASSKPRPAGYGDVLAVPKCNFDVTRRYAEGVKLRSEAHIAISCGAEPRPPKACRLVFDKPFLMLLQRAEAKVPYFALWVDNPELLVRLDR